MQKHLAEKKYGAVAHTSRLLERIHALQKQYSNFEHDLVDIESEAKKLDSGKDNGHETPLRFSMSERRTGRAEPQTIQISIDWKLNGRNKQREEFSFAKATDSMVEFVSRVVEAFGDAALQKLVEFRVNRGPLLSRFPERDFRSYQYKKLPNTDYFLLTHSSTPEKVEVLKKIVRAVGFIPGSVEIKAVNRFNALKDFQL